MIIGVHRVQDGTGVAVAGTNSEGTCRTTVHQRVDGRVELFTGENDIVRLLRDQAETRNNVMVTNFLLVHPDEDHSSIICWPNLTIQSLDDAPPLCEWCGCQGHVCMIGAPLPSEHAVAIPGLSGPMKTYVRAGEWRMDMTIDRRRYHA